MILPPEDAALFYRAWWPLLKWVNDKRRVVPPFALPTPERPLSIPVANPIRQLLWGDDALRELYLAEGAPEPGQRSELIASWKHRVSGDFVVLKHLRAHSIFLSKEVFGVVGIYSPLAELLRAVPAFATAVLLPFGDRIIIDGILTSPDIRLSFGAGARRSFETQYSSARAQGQIRTSLLPTTPPVSTKRPPVTRARSVAAAPPILGTWQITETEL